MTATNTGKQWIFICDFGSFHLLEYHCDIPYLRWYIYIYKCQVWLSHCEIWWTLGAFANKGPHIWWWIMLFLMNIATNYFFSPILKPNWTIPNSQTGHSVQTVGKRQLEPVGRIFMWDTLEATNLQEIWGLYTYVRMSVRTYIPFHSIPFHSIPFHCIALHSIALHCIALHCIHTYTHIYIYRESIFTYIYM